MENSAQHDTWAAGDAYEAYIGRWSYRIGSSFLKFLQVKPGLEWVDVGSGTGALSRAIVDGCQPARLTGVEPSERMRRWAWQQLNDARVQFIDGDASSLPLDNSVTDVAVSGLVLNFIANPLGALGEMKRIVRPGGRVAYYVWDYAHGGLEIVRVFWEAAVSLDPAASRFSDAVRFSWCDADVLSELMVQAGIDAVSSERIVIPTRFKSFEDYWHRFSHGAGPASSYYQQLSRHHQLEIRAALKSAFRYHSDGSIDLRAAAWAIQGSV